MTYLLDTGPLVAFMNQSDAQHEWASDTLHGLPAPLWTCEPVLTEVAYLTGAGRQLMGMVARGFLRIGIEVEEQAEHLQRLLQRYGPRMDFADACVVRMSEIHRQCKVVTLDRRDFNVYRRNSREVIPLIAPE